MKTFLIALVICVLGYVVPLFTNIAETDVMFYLHNGSWSMAAYGLLCILSRNGFIIALCGVEITAILLNFITVAGLKTGNGYLHDHYDTIVPYLHIAEASIFLSWLIMRAIPIIKATLRGLNGLCKLVFERVGLVYNVHKRNYISNHKVRHAPSRVVS